jgi:hypothetical protein
MRQYFKDINLDKRVKSDGFVVIPFLNAVELSNLKNTFNSIPKSEINSFYATSHQPDLDFRMRMSEIIKQNISSTLNEYMLDMDLLGGAFIAKPPFYNEVLQPHQDWNIVDESTFRSFNVWIPLVDLNHENGAIMVMPGSHNWIDTYRHSSIPCAFSQIHSLLLENMQTLYLMAGEALIYDHALIHASHENKSGEIRVACASGIKPKEADMLLYWNNDGKIEKYQSNADFFMNENVFIKPNKLPKMQSVDYHFRTFSESEFYNFSGIVQPKAKKHLKQLSEHPIKELDFLKKYSPQNIFREIMLKWKRK